MKSFIKVIGIAVFMAIIGFSMITCGGADGGGGTGGTGGGGGGGGGGSGSATIKIVNNYTNPITKVAINQGNPSIAAVFTDQIAAGATKTYSYNFSSNQPGVNSIIALNADGVQCTNDPGNPYYFGGSPNTAIIYTFLDKGITITITLVSESSVTVLSN